MAGSDLICYGKEVIEQAIEYTASQPFNRLLHIYIHLAHYYNNTIGLFYEVEWAPEIVIYLWQG